ncbi:MAG: hypothetical protein K0B16_01510 [Burkholderiaceae bacterium]|nr:hypothetical protein [Burkholderiaceae bacterium]
MSAIGRTTVLARARPLERGFGGMKTSSKVLAMLLAMALSVSVWAQTRKFPEQSNLGWLQVTVFPLATIDGNPARFTAGGRIFDISNRLVIPATLAGSVAVRYELDQGGQIQRAWILLPAEIEAARR